MRLSAKHVELIKQAAFEIFGERVKVRLFGSKADDRAKGGDIDLLVISETEVDSPVNLSAMLAARMYRALNGRKVDVIVEAPNIEKQPIHEIAKRTGVLL